MVKALAILLATASLAFGQAFTMRDSAWLANVNATAVQSCLTTDTTNAHDLVLEGFQTPTTGTNDGNSLTVAVYAATATNITFSADTTSLTNGKPAGACDRAMRVVVDTDGVLEWASWNYGSAFDLDATPMSVIFYLYIATGPDTGESFAVFTCGGNAAPSSTRTAWVTLVNTGSALVLRGIGTSTAADATVDTGQWYKVAVNLGVATTGSASSLQVDDGDAKTFDRVANDPQWFFFGSPYLLSENENADLYFDLICVD